MKRNIITGLLVLTLFPAYYLVSHRSGSNRTPDLRDSLRDDSLTDAGRDNSAGNGKVRSSRHAPSQQVPDMPGSSEENDMRDAVRNDSVDGGPGSSEGPGGGPQLPSLNNPPDTNVSNGNMNNYTPGTSVLATREVVESGEISPSAP